jgi:SNF2 family DNA or RNA helicase
MAIRAFQSDRRVALTGTPVENRLSELWSIMDFLNPGYLGSSQQFRRRYALNIERYRDTTRIEQLRQLIQPFILRRLKTDPNVIADLPEKQEAKIYTTLTPEQVRLYETVVRTMLEETNVAEGMRRRSLILAALVKLKQVCNHPGHYLRETVGNDPGAIQPGRSGKSARLIAMLEEVVAEGDAALVFTQFRQMGHLLAGMIRKELGVEVLFLHGGTPIKKREELIERFQKRDGSTPIFVLSLKAGGFGLNLTAANHVFHYDRWWNPAVENQATDRAFRIGQTRRVLVHKFVCSGTLEERVDEMIEQKVELAQNVIGSGERWLTELSTDQLREVLSLSYEDADPTHAGKKPVGITASEIRRQVGASTSEDEDDDDDDGGQEHD